MRYNKIIAMSVFLLATGNASATGVTPGFTALKTAANANLGVPVNADFSFDQTGLTGTFNGSSAKGWTLTVNGTGNSAFYLPGATTVDTIKDTHYTLTANFTSAGVFLPTGSTLTITGALNTELSNYGAAASTGYGSLYSANLTSFGYSASEAAIGFSTAFQSSAWSSQGTFTGYSAGDVIYLFNQGGISTGFGVLSGLINQFATGSFTSTSIANVESLAAVPLPLSAVLFGSGLIGLLGLGRQRRNIPKSI